MSDRPAGKELNFAAIQPQLKELLLACGNWIERSWPGARPLSAPDHAGSRSLLLSMVRSSEMTWKAITYLCADIPPDPARLKEFVLVVTPMSRTILETLATTIFVFAKLPTHVRWFYRTGWRETSERYERLANRFGADPDWHDHLAELQKFREDQRIAWGITVEDAEDMKKRMPYFPLPSQMVAVLGATTERGEQLQYLMDWYYREMSQDAHLSWPGLTRRAGLLLPATTPAERAAILPHIRADVVDSTVALLLALVSEIEIECRFPSLAKQVQYVWTVQSDYSLHTKELYDRFYKEKLTAAAAAT